MSIYDDVRAAAEKSGVQLDQGGVYRVAGTLRTAYGETATFDTIMQEVLNAANRAKQQPVAPVQQVQSDVVVQVPQGAEDGSQIAYSNLDTALARGICPRCSKALKNVKLADYTEARHCVDCRITLW
jgi:hypothetical protein